MAKSLEQINNEYLASRSQKQSEYIYGRRKKKKSQVIATGLSNVLYYGAIIFLLMSAISFSVSGSGGGSLAGYSVFQVLSGSMESVYPRGSMVVVKEVDVTEIGVGDDITFMMNETDTATHRVIEIVEDYDDSQTLAFRTQGVENARPDDGYVDERNVIGKVIFCVPMMGFIMDQIAENIWLAVIMFVLLIILSFALKTLWNGRKYTAEYH